MRKIFILLLALLYIIALGQADSLTATSLISQFDDINMANPLSSQAAGNQPYLINHPQIQYSFLSLDSSMADNILRVAKTLQQASYENISGLNPLLSGQAGTFSLLIEDLFPAQPPDKALIAREIAALRFSLTGDATVLLSEEINNSVSYHTDNSVMMRQKPDIQLRTSGQDIGLQEEVSADHPAAPNQISTLEAALQAGASAEKPEKYNMSLKPDDDLTEASTSPSEQATLAQEAAVPQTPVAEKQAHLSGSDPAAPGQPDFDAIAPFVTSWAAAWEKQDAERYLSHYADNFKTPRSISMASWKKQRHQRLGRSRFIKIEINDMEIEKVNGSGARATFIQEYQSNTYADQAAKTLELVWENGAWLIMKEISTTLKKH